MTQFNVSYFTREPAELVMINGKPEKVRFIASGACCLVYVREDGSIIKEFFPIINGKIPVLAREKRAVTVKETVLVDAQYETVEKTVFVDYLSELPILDKDASLRAAYERCKKRFEENVNVAALIYKEYSEINANMGVLQSRLETQDGLWQVCPYVGGWVLDKHLEKMHEGGRFRFFCNVLDTVYKLINDTIMYHNLDYINLDIKHHNLYAVTGDTALGTGEAETRYSISSIRNLDFGSARNIPETLSEIKEKYANAGIQNDYVIGEISSEYFSTTELFYRESTVRATIKLCLDPNVPYKKKVRELKRLDAIAILKLMLYALNDELSDDLSVMVKSKKPFGYFGGGGLDEYNALLDKMKKYMLQGTLLEDGNPLQDYDIYYRLYDLICYVTHPSSDCDLEGFRDRIEEILCICGFNPILQYDPPRNVREAKQFHLEYARTGTEILKDNGLCSLEDILNFCTKRGIAMPALPGEIYYNLITGMLFDDDGEGGR